MTRWLLRAGMAWLLAGLAGGVLVAGHDALGLPTAVGAAGPAVFHLLTVGWLTQLIFGVAHWMFPRAGADRPRGREALMWAALLLVNAGLLLRLAAEPLAALGHATGPALAASGLLQFAAAACFTANTWPRVRGR
ncbi:MAG TPA: hypothetical protein VLA95_07750 [Gemmatimonadales bacterium]|nr:hypothetical protein [Gemmatimonadales bacterium]